MNSLVQRVFISVYYHAFKEKSPLLKIADTYSFDIVENTFLTFDMVEIPSDEAPSRRELPRAIVAISQDCIVCGIQKVDRDDLLRHLAVMKHGLFWCRSSPEAVSRGGENHVGIYDTLPVVPW